MQKLIKIQDGSMKVVIFYFSGTGNTWWCSMQLKEELENSGNTVSVYSLENPVLHEDGFVENTIAEADQVIVGYPIYGSDVPRNMMDFLDRLPQVTDRTKFASFCTQAAFSGDGNHFYRKTIEAKGYRFLQSFQVNLTTNFNVAMFPFSFSKPAEGKKLERIKQKARTKLRRIAGVITDGKEYFEGTYVYQVLSGRLQRKFFRRGEKKLPGKFSFHRDRCTKCKLCVTTCPTDNLELDMETGDLLRKDRCLLCFRCYNFCPGLAINFGGKVKNPDKYKRFTGPVEKLSLSEIRK